MKFFQKVNMESETVAAKNRTGVFQVSGSNAVCAHGDFVILGDLASNTTYANFLSGSVVKDMNKFVCTAPSAVTDKPVYVADFIKISEGTIMGNTYREGAKTLGLTANAGEPIALRKVELTDQFILGSDNFASAPTVGNYAILTAGSPILTGSAGKGSGFAVAVDQYVTLSQGVTGNATGYLCHVVQL